MRGQTRTAARRAAARARTRARSSSSSSSSPSASDSESVSLARPAKRRKTASSSSTSKLDAYRALLLLHQQKPTADLTTPSLPPTRCHTLAYHVPLLLLVDGGPRAAFLSWFDSVSSARAMPWRKPWIDPSSFASPSELRAALEKRAYEVWISEIMLQQTRVAVVVDYWKRWMSKWPTIHDLAAADTDDVLAAWRGLGYYSRATRIHTAAQLAVGDPSMQGLLPSSAADLAEKIPGVGRYTAGAISCIAFGRPAPMVDGNVLRVLSRQLGLYGNIKTDKAVIDLIWAAAEALVNAVALDGEDGEEVAAADTRSDRPGRWGQALMELGSTVCAPRPDCGACPITSTCRAYSEGLALLSKEKSRVGENGIADMEDLCGVCQPFDDTDDVENQPPPPAVTKGGKQATLSAFFAKSAVPAKPSAKPKVDIDGIVRHARRFPIKAVKKAVREEETLVCAVVRADGRYLIWKRPAKGLLAGLWEFPSSLLENPKGSKAAERKKLAREFVEGWLNKDEVEHVGELGSVPWLFSHIRLTMHVHLFKIKGTEDAGVERTTEARWSDSVDTESMGTGMRKCWELVKEAT
ncbi:A/G-specific adenine glycosylase [Beauveria bassiana ARSEF 2860]|uniref:Adenine DNA glycosylase n=1 Tax=Beauveria bassiana (strain ARSEF 2860) TaxID=655819 RepID=J4KLA9_BEAB2|nr:A/G-specific adenine glycosylase [Beauveria bassiana ARSEF 2860]EJP61884.1 A/G-specific adenine glycosylase [Beauveria bassiana ARSEF 2860]